MYYSIINTIVRVTSMIEDKFIILRSINYYVYTYLGKYIFDSEPNKRTHIYIIISILMI